MIQYHNGVPFCIMQQEEAGVSINFDGVINLLHKVEKDLMNMEVPEGTAYTSNDISSRREPILLDLAQMTTNAT